MKSMWIFLSLIFSIFNVFSISNASATTVHLSREKNGTYDLVVQIPRSQIHSEAVEANGLRFTKLNIADALPSGNIGDPAVPMLHELIALPKGMTYRSVVKLSKPMTFRDVLLYPIQAQRKEKLAAPPFKFNYDSYRSSESLQSIELQSLISLGKNQALPVIINPTQYVPNSRNLVVYRHMEIQLIPEQMDHGSFTLNPGLPLEQREIEGLTLNGRSSISISVPRAPGVLLITSQALSKEANAFAALHPEAKFDIEVLKPLTTTDVVSALIKDRYLTGAVDTLVLYGDELQVPPAAWDGINSDTFYGVGLTTPADNLIHLAIGRIPAQNQKDAQFLNDKIASYIASRDFNREKKVMLVAHNEYAGQVDSFQNNQEIIRTSPNPMGLNFTTFYGGKSATNAQVVAATPNHYQLINYRGHGSDIEWWNWDSKATSFTTPEISQLANLGADVAIYFNIACENGLMESPKRNLSEQLMFLDKMKGQHRGAVAALGSTSDSDHDINNQFDIALFKGIQGAPGIAIGQLITMADNKLIVDNANQPVDNVKMYALFGDPLLVLW
jgi:hypothetical protein